MKRQKTNIRINYNDNKIGFVQIYKYDDKKSYHTRMETIIKKIGD